MGKRFFVVVLMLLLCPMSLMAQKRNFTSNDAKAVEVAERSRSYSAIFWSGKELPAKWYKPCPIKCEIGSHAASGNTSFIFGKDHRGRDSVYGWDMRVRGSATMVYESVIPHEVDHTVRACLAGRPITRWLDEGCCVLMESAREHEGYRRAAKQGLHRGTLFRYIDHKEYPTDGQVLAEVYGGGFSLVEYLITQGTRKNLLAFNKDPRRPSDKFKAYYGRDVHQMERDWKAWFTSRAKKGFDCDSFGCCRHSRAPNPPAITKRVTEYRPKVIVFTQGELCGPCISLEQDIDRYGYRDDVVYVKPQTDAWRRAEYDFRELTSYQKPMTTPILWVPGTNQYHVGYVRQRREGGLIPTLFQALFGKRVHPRPNGILRDPNCAAPRPEWEPPVSQPPVPPDDYDSSDNDDHIRIETRLDAIEHSLLDSKNRIKLLATTSNRVQLELQQLSVDLKARLEALANQDPIPPAEIPDYDSRFERIEISLIALQEAVDGMAGKAQLTAIYERLAILDETLAAIAESGTGEGWGPLEAKLRELEISIQRVNGTLSSSGKAVELLNSKLDTIQNAVKELAIEGQHQSVRIQRVENELKSTSSEIKKTNERLSGKLKINVRVDEDRDVQLKE